MLSTILIVDLVLFVIIALWVGVINVTGNTDQKGGASLVAFFLVSAIAIGSAIIAMAGFVINIIWN